METRSATLETRSGPPAGSAYFAEHAEVARTTTHAEIDASLATLRSSSQGWVHESIPERRAILGEVRASMLGVADRWVQAEVAAKRITPGSLGEGEEWTLLATVFRAIRTLERSLGEIERSGRPTLPGEVRCTSDGQVVVRTFPATLADRLLFLGVTGEVWMEPGVTPDSLRATQAASYANADQPGRVALVLGAGNASMLPVIDFLHKLFVELQVVILKLNPVNAHLGPLMEESFRALVDRGLLAFVYGGVEEGAYLASHDLVDELHVTGSDKTYEAVVFGSGPDGERRKRERAPLVSKRFTGELGNVSPVIVVPGPWQPRDVGAQASQLATWLVANAGFACLTPRVIVQHASWDQRSRLMDEVGNRLRAYPTRSAYYPGADSRHAEFIAAHPAAQQYGNPSEGELPWTVIADVSPEDRNDICFRREAFCGLFAETGLEAPDPASFVDRAVDFANDTLWGTLSATIIVHPKSLADPDVAAAIERAIANLRYGTVALNMLAFYGAYFMTAPWGAFPGHDAGDIQSGIGKTFNFLMLDRPEKSVIRAPFRRLDPVTIESKRAAEFCRRLADFEASPSWWKLPGLALTALRS
jgi:acyl-CoA reductase-like NAD-dependent aldehyde dehydrogenase